MYSAVYVFSPAHSTPRIIFLRTRPHGFANLSALNPAAGYFFPLELRGMSAAVPQLPVGIRGGLRMSNNDVKVSSFKSSDNYNENENGPYRGFGY